MKTLVTFMTETGNTQKLAQAIYDAITGSDKNMAPLAKVEGADVFDVYFVGFPVQGGSVPSPAEKFLKGIPEGKQVVIFATHGSLRGGQLAITAFHHAIALAPQTNIIGTFGCRGEVKESIIEALLEKPAHRGWAMEAQSAAGHPDDADLEDAREFTKMMMSKAMQS
jgi:flavodoxin